MLTLATYHPAHILRQNTRLNGVFKADLNKAVRLSKGWKPAWTDTDLMYEPLPVDDIVRVIDSMGGRVTYDVETDGRHPLQCDLRCLGLYDGTKGIIVPYLYRTGERRDVMVETVVSRATGETKIDVQNRAVWKRSFGDAQEKRIHDALGRLWKRATPEAQNGQYDRMVLKAAKKVIIPRGHDTILRHHVLRPYLPHGLGFISSLYTEIPYYKATDSGDSWAAETDLELYLYCLRDVKTTWLAARTMDEELAAARPEDRTVYEQDLWQEEQCQKWTERGLKVDLEALDFFRHKYRNAARKAMEQMRMLVRDHLRGASSTDALEELTAMLEDAADDTYIDGDGGMHEVFNPASLRQLRALLRHLGVPLTEMTATGEVSTAKEFLTAARKDLARASPNHPGVVFLDYLFAWREASKVNSTYLYPKILDDGRVHPTFSVHVVPTGRLSSKDPNCFSADTEVLTPAGWQRLDVYVEAPTTVMQWHPGNTVSWTTAIATIVEPSTDWVHIQNEHIDLKVTGDHRCVVESRRGDLKVVEAHRYPEDHKQFNAVTGWREGEEPSSVDLTDDELRLIIAAQADGTWAGSGIEFAFMKARKIQRMRALLKRLNVSFSERKRGADSRTGSSVTRFRVHMGLLTVKVRAYLGVEKTFGGWVLRLSKHQREVFMSEVMLWDGCATRMNHYASMHRSNADWVQLVYVLSGRRANVRIYNPKPGAWNAAPKPSYQVDVSRNAYTWTTNRELTKSSESALSYCLSVPSSFVLVRRNGKVMVCGQCQNQPADIRGMYVADVGHTFVYGDWDALEMRLGAFMSEDPAFVEAFRNYDAKTGPKPHIVNMGNIFGLPKTAEAADQNPGMYRAAKVFAYAVAYGAGDATVFEQVREELPDIDLKTFMVCMKNYKAAYPMLFAFQKKLVEQGTRLGYIDTKVLGRRGYFFEKPRGFDSQSPEASAMQNFPYQGTGADIVGLANRRILEEADQAMMRDIFQLAQVHDELLFEVPEAHEAAFKEAFKTLSKRSPKGFEHWNLPVDVKSKKRWKPVQHRCPAPCRELFDVEPIERTKEFVTWGGECPKCKTKHRIEVPRARA